MRLCFGTFAMVLNCCRYNISQALLITKLMIIVDPSKQYIGQTIITNSDGKKELKGDDPTAHKYLHCKTNFIFSDSNRANSIAPNEVIQSFSTEISPFIEEDKKFKVILTLLNMIQEDTYIDSEKKEAFKKYLGIEKTQLSKKSEFVFSDFLGRILLYTVLSGVSNKVGKEYVKKITNEYIETIAQPYIYDYQWDKSTETLILSYLKTFNLFLDAISEYQINIFIEKIDPTVQLDFGWVETCDNFLNYIQNKIILPFENDSDLKNSKMLDYISHFANVLDEYLRYVGLHTRPFSENSDIMLPIHREEDIEWCLSFEAKVKEYRERIISIYQKIYLYAMPYQSMPDS